MESVGSFVELCVFFGVGLRKCTPALVVVLQIIAVFYCSLLAVFRADEFKSQRIKLVGQPQFLLLYSSCRVEQGVGVARSIDVVDEEVAFPVDRVFAVDVNFIETVLIRHNQPSRRGEVEVFKAYNQLVEQRFVGDGVDVVGAGCVVICRTDEFPRNSPYVPIRRLIEADRGMGAEYAVHVYVRYHTVGLWIIAEEAAFG